MEDSTFRSRLVDLLKKSRKAVRLYEGMGRAGTGLKSELAGAQAEEWRNINVDLMQELSTALDDPSQRRLSNDVIAMRERFSSNWHAAESELLKKQTELLACSKNGDYVRATLLASELVTLKARAQATQAVHHELSDVIKRSKVTASEEDFPVDIPHSDLPSATQGRILNFKRN